MTDPHDTWSAPPPRPAVPGRFSGKVALVTGASHGIGLAIATELLREGAAVVGSSLPSDAADGAAALTAAGFEGVPLVSGDLSDPGFCKALVDTAMELHGRVDLLVNNAFSFLARGLDATPGDFDRVFSVGPVAFATLMQLVASRSMEEGGAIVNVSSISAWVAQPNRWTYNCAKAAVTQLTRCAALDLGPRR